MKIEITATKRNTQGTGASRRLRKAGRLPGVVYGSGDAVAIEMDHNAMYHMLRKEAFHASVLNLVLDGKTEMVQLRTFVMHPFRQQVQHIDFQRVVAKQVLHIKVPLHFLNEEEAPGIKLHHGTFNHVHTELEIECLPKDIPESISVDVGAMEIGDIIHAGDIKLPADVHLYDQSDDSKHEVVVNVLPPVVETAEEEEAEVPAEAAVGEAPAEAAEEDGK